MKKILMIAVVSLFGGKLMAQKNTILVYGQAGFENKKDFNDDKTTSFTLSPCIGYQFDDHITAGIQLNVAGTKFNGAAVNIPESKTSVLGVGPFVRYTRKLSDVFFVFGQLEGSYIYGKQKLGNTTISKANGVSGNIFPAVGINVYKGFALNFNVGGISYVTTKFEGSDNRQNNFKTSFGDQVNFGISKNF